MAEPLNFGIEVNLKPVSYIENNIITGLQPEMVRLLFEDTGIEVNFTAYSTIYRALQDVASGKMDLGLGLIIGNTTKNHYPDRILFTDQPLYIGEVLAYTNRDKSIELASMQDVYPLLTGVIRTPSAWRSHIHDKPLSNVIRFDDRIAIMKSLLMGRIDIAMADDLHFQYKALLYDPQKKIRPSLLVSRMGVYVIIHNHDKFKRPGKLLSILNKRLQLINSNGSAEGLTRYYYSFINQLPPQYRKGGGEK